MTGAMNEQPPPKEEKPLEQKELPLPKQNHKKRKAMIETTLAFLIISIAIFLYWFFILRFEVSTDDAYVEGDLVNINTRQQGYVTAFYADNTDLVEEGQLLVSLDPTDYLLKFEESLNNLILQTREVKTTSERVKELEQEVKIKQADFLLALYDSENRGPLKEIGAVSNEEWKTYETKTETAYASLKMTEHMLNGLKAKLGEGPLDQNPMIEAAKEEMRQDYLRVKRCQIYSPTRGFVAKRNIDVGEYAEVTRNMMSVIPLNRIWVTANYKETQLYYLRIGQSVKVYVDQYGRSVVFRGKIQGIGAGTGAVFSLLPPQNATGNWIKIVQRLPVRILLEPDEIIEHPLRLGLSCYTITDIRNVEGEVLAQDPNPRIVQKTNVYEVSMEELEKTMGKIIQANLSYPV